MKTIFNFGHPVTVEQLAEYEKRFPGVVIETVKVQLNLDQESLKKQVEDIVDEAIGRLHSNNGHLVAIVPPSLAPAAFWVGQMFASVPAVWLHNVPGEVPLKFYVGGIE